MTDQGRLGIKLLAEQAKKRLARNGRVSTGIANQGYAPTKVKYLQERIIMNNDEEEFLYQKIKQIFSQNQTVINPIGQLIDQNKFKSMSTIERDAYIIKMVDTFQTLKQRFELENTLNNRQEIS